MIFFTKESTSLTSENSPTETRRSHSLYLHPYLTWKSYNEWTSARPSTS